MISQAQVAQIEDLLKRERLSHRQIARLTGISRSTIGAIARGRRPDCSRYSPPGDWAQEPHGPIAWCHGCGGRVQMPCRLCRVRQLKQAEQDRRRRLARLLADPQRLARAAREYFFIGQD